MSFSLGIVGLPNVGKSTLFKALTKKQVDASNYPFCTIDPNVGVVAVPDERLEKLAKLSVSKKIIPTTIEFVDIAGLVKGAAQGEGLGNKFLQNIRGVDAIVEVVRSFEDPNVIHVHGKVNPEYDKEIIKLELVLADLDVAERRLSKVIVQLKGPKDVHLEAERALLEKIVPHLKAEHMVQTLEIADDERALLKQYNFLTAKPFIYVYNVSENELKAAIKLPSNAVAICAKLEAELADLSDEDARVYLAELGLKESGLSQLITKSYKLLELITFLTTGPEETRAWTTHTGSRAPQAAGVIHTDFEKGFIRADVIGWQELLAAGSWVAGREKGTLRTEGKEYIVQDGDVVHFHFN